MTPPIRFLTLDWPEYTRDRDTHESLLRWARAHGIDPCDVLGSQVIEVDDDTRQIRYEAITRDTNGTIQVKDGQAVTEHRTLQLEAPALPLPDLTPRQRT